MDYLVVFVLSFITLFMIMFIISVLGSKGYCVKASQFCDKLFECSYYFFLLLRCIAIVGIFLLTLLVAAEWIELKTALSIITFGYL